MLSAARAEVCAEQRYELLNVACNGKPFHVIVPVDHRCQEEYVKVIGLIGYHPFLPGMQCFCANVRVSEVRNWSRPC